MPIYDTGDKVRVSQDSSTPYRGMTGVVESYLEELVGVMCQVRFPDAANLPPVEWFPEEMLDPAD